MAEIRVQLLEDDAGWSPYLSVDEAYVLDGVREALRQGDLETAAWYGRIYEMRPIAGA
ncbi:hypothetical protein [Halovibrio salipaludis]|uniref:hypothetical protein n=1 Tax=Halovibrio salipaludis TaxID=2032626 RepID=UPI0018E977E4|nr:hypothetical protein [Halovibrio salipaludis]